MALKRYEQFTDNILIQASTLYEFSLETLQKIGGYENDVYSFQKGEKEYILRVGHTEHRSLEDVTAEMDFIAYLARNHANVSLPISSIHENYVESIAINKEDAFLVIVFEKARGEHIKKGMINEALIEEIGRTIGQFHRLAKSYQPSKKEYVRMNWDEDPLVLKAKEILKDDAILSYNHFNTLIDQIHRIPKTTETFGIMHGDVHFGNFFYDGTSITVFDFDDTMMFYYNSDIAICLFYYMLFVEGEQQREKEAVYFLTNFLRGYRKENNIPPLALETLDYFLKFREWILYLVIHQNKKYSFNDWEQKYINFYTDRIATNKRFVNVDFHRFLDKSTI